MISFPGQWATLTFCELGFKVWRRLNHVSSAVFADGLHETVKEGQHLPFFLIQLRKRIFARVYGSDISFAVFLGRPPRVSKRFCFTNMPLDLDEDAYELVGDTLDQELSHLDQNGWNSRGVVRKSAVVRWSMITSMIREDTLEVLLGRNLSNVPQRIRYVVSPILDHGDSCLNGDSELRSRIDHAWNDLPSFLTVPCRDLWQRGRSCHEVDTLHQIRLFYLHTTFLIEWTASRHGLDQIGELFTKASELLAWVNEALVRREQLFELGHTSLAWRVGILNQWAQWILC